MALSVYDHETDPDQKPLQAPNGDHDKLADADRDKAAFEDLERGYYNNEASDIMEHNFGPKADETSLDDQETAAADTTAAAKESEDDTVGKGYAASAKKKGKGLASKVRNSKKFLVFGTAGVGAGLIAGIVILFILASSLKLPNITQNIVGYQFARLSRTFSQAGDKITDESLAKMITKKLSETELGQAAKQKIQETKDKINQVHDQATGLKDGAIDKIKGIPGATQFLILNDTYNPFQVQKNLQGYGLTYGTDGNGRPFITIAGKAAEDLRFDPQSFILGPPKKSIGRFIPVFSEYLTAKTNIQFFTDDLFKHALRNAYNNSLRLNSVPTFVRGIAMNSILKRIGINRAGLVINYFRNARDYKEQAKLIDEQAKIMDEYYSKQTAPTTPVVPDSGPSGDAAQQAADDQQAAMQAAEDDPTGKAAAALAGDDSTGIAEKVPEDLAKAAAHGSATATISRFIAGPIFNAAYLGCVFDAGANSGDNNKIIDSNNDANEKSFALLASASDQLQRGPLSSDQLTAFDNAQSAMNHKLGSDEQYSVPLLRARGASYDTSTEQAAQSTPYGFQTPEKTINNSLFWNFMQSVQGSCSVISSAWTAGAVALANLAGVILTLPTGGEGAEAEAGVEAVSQSTLKVVLGKVSATVGKSISENFGRQAGVKLAAKNAVTKTYKLFKQIIKNGAVVVGTESLGSMMAAYHVPSLNHTGYETGNTFIAQADAGGNATAQEQMRIMLFGRPLLKTETCQANSLDRTYEQTAFEPQNAYQRYLAVKNPQSLLSRTALAVHDNLSGSLGKPLASLATVIGNPLGWLSGIFGYRAFADAASNCDSSTAFYGNVQIGWSQDEINLTDSNDSYNPDENMAILAQSGKANAIAQKYGVCFGYSYTGGDNNSISTDPNATVGYLLTGGSGGQQLITRDEQGNIINDDSAKCSPEYLSYVSKDTDLATDNNPDSPQRDDLIFRWRLAMKYTNVQNQLIAIQRARGTSST
ncbi:MAG TPA: hypothetical protein VLG92_00840 [Candidatus Saccharimonadia bacterium]|nr:hypothetical protein [Candidatus Saccharimonadia bacterium]